MESMGESQAIDLIMALFVIVVGGSFGVAVVRRSEELNGEVSRQWQELEQKVKSQNKEISSSLQSLRQAKEGLQQAKEGLQKECEQWQELGEQWQQWQELRQKDNQSLSSAVSRMEEKLAKMKTPPKP